MKGSHAFTFPPFLVGLKRMIVKTSWRAKRMIVKTSWWAKGMIVKTDIKGERMSGPNVKTGIMQK
ncbi:hypothetical protein BLX87_11945 [Bacillus sp. VT-16-64]|nr:hypothetical protein BLX87_11945 [Bacillus sp. VT-16-64]